MQGNTKARRSYGEGSLIERTDKTGRVTWYGKWRDASGKQRMRKLGLKRDRDGVGMTAREAGKALGALVRDTPAAATVVERLTVEDVGSRHLDHLTQMGKVKASTVHDYRIILNAHLRVYFKSRAIDAVTKADVKGYMRSKLAPAGMERADRRKAGKLGPKTVNNHLNYLHSLFEFAIDEDYTTVNPVHGVTRPGSSASQEIRYLSVEELEALLRAIPGDTLGPTDRALYITSAMTGLRQGELCALRWRDVDFAAKTVRVRQSPRGARRAPRRAAGQADGRRSCRELPKSLPATRGARLTRTRMRWSSRTLTPAVTTTLPRCASGSTTQ